MALSDNDLFVYQNYQTGNLGSVQTQNLGNLADDDLFIVQKASDGSLAKVKKSDLPSGGGDGDFSTVTITPSSITPTPDKQEITCTTDVPTVNGTAPADVEYCWYQYDDATGLAGQVELAKTISRQITNKLTLPSSAAGKYIGCNVTYLAVTKSETSRCQVLEPVGPTATMYGLRWDSGRATNMSRTVGPSNTQGTMSWWYKPTSFAWVVSLYTQGVSASGYSQLQVMTDGSIKLWWVNDTVESDLKITLNRWNNIIYAFGNSDTSKNGLWINGVKDTADWSAWYTATAGQTFIYEDALFNLGNQNLGFGGSTTVTQVLDGYLSDCYFISGITLPPETFGRKYAQGWGPVDSTIVAAELAKLPVSPYDERPIMTYNWGSSLTTSVGSVGTPAYAFDGNLANKAYIDGGTVGSTMTWVNSNNVQGDVWRVWSYTGGSSSQACIVNDINVYDNAEEKDGQYAWVTIPKNPPSIIIENQNAGAGTLGAIEVDGRILVNGPADNSRSDWVISATGFDLSNPPAYAFDGGDPASTYAYPASGSELVMNVNITSNKFQIYALSGTQSGFKFGDVYVNGNKIPDTGGWRDVTAYVSGGTLTELKATYADYPAGISAVKIGDDEIELINGGTQWDTSEVWSDKTAITAGTLDPTTPLTMLFDGNVANGVRPSSGQSVTLTWPSGLIQGDQVELFTYETGGPGPLQYTDGDTPKQINSPNVNGWNNLGAINLTSMTWSYPGGSNVLYVLAIRVDGEILVNNVGYGANGFYLPFNPDAVGVDYSNGTTTGNLYSDQPWYRAFDGDSSVSSYAQSDGGPATLTFTNPIPFDDKVEISGNGDLTVNGTNITVPAYTFTEVTGITSPLTSIGMQSGNQPISAVKVDGRILVNHSSIGVDGSGNKNNFYDQNFAVGNTSKIWSNNLETVSAAFPAGYGPTNAFDGSITTECSSGGDGTTTYLTLSDLGFTGSNSLKVYVNGGNIEVNGQVVAGVSSGPEWVDCGTVENLDTIRIYGESSKAASLYSVEVDSQLLIDAIIQDTVIDTPMNSYTVALTGANGNLQMNTTQIDSRASLPFSGDTKYYYETLVNGQTTNIGAGNADNSVGLGFDGLISNITITKGASKAFVNGDVVGVSGNSSELSFYINGEFTCSGTPTINTDNFTFATGGGAGEYSQVNFGQQPFAYATNNMNGTCTIDTGENTDQVWSSNMTASPSPVVNPTYAFNGDTSNYASSTPADISGSGGATLTWNLPQSITVSKGLRFFLYSDAGAAYGTQTYKINNNSAVSYLGQGISTWIDTGYTGTLEKVEFNSIKNNQNAGFVQLYAVEVDDKVLVNPDFATPTTYQLLFQPWSVWVQETVTQLLATYSTRIEALEQVFLSMAVDWSYGSTYQENDIVKFNCSLHRALSDGITTRSPVTANSDVWENLYIDCERTHSMNLDDLIPDDWSQEQRQAALQELLQELSNEEPESY